MEMASGQQVMAKRSIDALPFATASHLALKRIVSVNEAEKVETLRAIRRDHYRRHSVLDPTEVLLSILRVKQIHVPICSYDDLKDFFHQNDASDDQQEYPASNKESIDSELVSTLPPSTLIATIFHAVRSGNVELLRELWRENTMTSQAQESNSSSINSTNHKFDHRFLHCCNKARESILHLACRRGQTEVVRFLLQEVKVSACVCDDYGRNPMHDACWTPEPNFEVMDLLLAKCPDLLFIKDMRGHTPLRYAPKQHWKTWVKHLAKKIPVILPRYLPYEVGPPKG